MMENGSNEERDFLTPSPSLEPAEDSREQSQTSQGPLSIQAEEVAEVRVEPRHAEELSSGGESDRETELTRVRVSSYFESRPHYICFRRNSRQPPSPMTIRMRSSLKMPRAVQRLSPKLLTVSAPETSISSC